LKGLALQLVVGGASNVKRDAHCSNSGHVRDSILVTSRLVRQFAEWHATTERESPAMP